MTDNLDGGKASVTLGATTYLCINNANWTGSVQDLASQCSGSSGATTVRRPGTPDDQFTFDILVDAQDVTKINALKRGATFDTFECHPEGDDTDNVEFLATGAVILNSNLPFGPNTVTVLSITVGISGALTVQAAT